MGDAGDVQPVDGVPYAGHGGKGPAVRRVLHWRTDGAQHEQDVVGRGGAGGHDSLGEHALLAGEQAEEGLMLDLWQAAEGGRRPGLSVPDRAPDRHEQLRVLGVTPVDLDDQRFAVVVLAVDEEDAGRLAVGDTERPHAHTQLFQGSGNVGQTRPAAARPEQQVHRCRAGGGHEQSGHSRSGWCQIGEDRAERRQQGCPATEPSDGPAEVRARRHR